MSAIDRLRNRLKEEELPQLGLTVGGELSKLIQSMEKQYKAGSGQTHDEDLVKKAVGRFWPEKRFQSLRDAQLVSYGLTLRPEPSKPCIMEDAERLHAVLDAQVGVGQWLDTPRCFRRCYQGLISSYFTYDGRDPKKPNVGRSNWIDLRTYLWQHSTRIVGPEFNPDWVNLVTQNHSLFSQDPCASYASAALAGDTKFIDEITHELGVSKNSWFQWELIMAQVRQATGLNDEEFKALIPKLLALIAGNELVREKAMVQILDRYAHSSDPILHERLRDTSVAWWGNPWLPSDEVRWGGVQPATRNLVAEWLRRDFIEAFFAKLAKDGVGDKRRANFWLRYVKSMSDVRFGLGTTALVSRDRDFAVLREKMKGLFQRLEDPVSTNNAFIMTIGDLVAVEFGGESNAFYGYDRRKVLPFDVKKPLQVPVGAVNSLKHKEPVRVLWMQHQDGIKGFSRWEDMFAAELKNKFGVAPDDRKIQSRPASRAQTSGRDSSEHSPASSQMRPFSISELIHFSRARGFGFRDLRSKNGNLRVDTNDRNPEVNRVLTAWGFKYSERGEFWWMT
ncbi:EH signature domain-containing protein [Dyella jiangningensis]|uniref:EH signature domain-containing protein n=1 Tax=Dyella jiangningensis TaxID=1379159 RepID=UPI00240FCB12|nr:EH signature domain-containing protein [Dyella jiangningensis]MDG2539834.1 EH signature domain-containing protein [Dyella jiangningensis]